MRRVLFSICWPALLAPAAHGLDANVDVSTTAEYSSNITRQAENEQGDWIFQPSVYVGAGHEGPSTQLDASYQTTRRIYQDDSFDDDTVTTGSGSVVWNAIPSRLSFSASNTSTYTTIDSREIDTPDNRQSVYYTSAGATLTLDGLSNHDLQLAYKFGHTNSEETDTDSDRHTGSLAYVIPLSQVRTLRISGSHTSVDFDNELSPDYDAQSGSLEYSSSTRRLDLSLNAGYQVTERELARDDVDGFIGGIGAVFHSSPTNSISLEASRSIHDNFDGGGRGLVGRLEDLGELEDMLELTNTNEVYTLDSYRAGWNAGTASNQFTATAYRESRDYQDTPDDEDAVGAILTLTRTISSTSTLGFTAAWESRDFEQTDREDDFTRAGISYTDNRWRKLSLGASITYDRRDSDREDADSEEWRALIRLSYALYDHQPSDN